MKTSVNFYLEEFKPKPDPLSLKVVLYCWLTALLCMALMYGCADHQHTSLLAKQQELSQSLNRTKQENESLKQKATAHGFDPVLVKKVETLESEIKNKRSLIRAIKGDTLDERQSGFSGLMYDLADFRDQSLWITAIAYNRQDVVIRGATKKPATLPLWIDHISQSTHFRGRTLNKVELSSQADGQYSIFEVANDRALTIDATGLIEQKLAEKN
ncbi:hypothetical protein C2869_21530 [Saccharobesus litoralis]|uniref:Uncharacterized protein n=1 Tax=Saccharobesus litoralis TaxID=2172099 RepID=A0A2S0VX84_9ALTE|nr:PilN domain-containing protein [Saccharobesus litoralis]AWB68821.1 hypothetical protein C2869_21530 [Saccharobesus litoralis]